MLKKYFTKAFLMYITFNHQSVNLLAKCSCCCENNKEKSDSSPQKKINPINPINPKGPKNSKNPFFTTSTDPLSTPTTTTTTTKEPVPNTEEKEKIEKEKLIEESKEIIEEGIKNATELDKKMLKYLYFKININKTDDELKNEMLKECKLSEMDINTLEDFNKNEVPNFFKDRKYEKKLIDEKIRDCNIEIFNIGNDFQYCMKKGITDEIFRKYFFKIEYLYEEDSGEDIIYYKCYTDKGNPSRVYYYCFFNKSIMNKLVEKDKENIMELVKDRFFFLGYSLNMKPYIIHPENYHLKPEIDNELVCNLCVTYEP